MKPLEKILYGVCLALFWIVLSKLIGFENTVFSGMATIYVALINK